MERKSKNSTIDIVRFLSAIFMVLYHYNVFIHDWKDTTLFPCGYRLCEMFFVFSGYYLGKSIESQKYHSLSELITLRIKRLYPQYLVAFFLSFILISNEYLHHVSVKKILYFFQELFMMHEWIGRLWNGHINDMTWFVSAMIFADIFIYLLRTKVVKKQEHFIVLSSIYIIFAILFFSCAYGHLHKEGLRAYGLVSVGCARALLGVSAGYLVSLIKGEDNNSKKGVVFFVIGCFVSVILLFVKKNSYCDFFMILSSALIIFSSDSVFVHSKLVEKLSLGEMSYVIYLTQLIVLDCMTGLKCQVNPYVYLAVCISFSSCLVFLEKIIRIGISKRGLR